MCWPQAKTFVIVCLHHLKKYTEGFPRGAVVKSLQSNAGDISLIPGLGISHMPWSN